MPFEKEKWSSIEPHKPQRRYETSPAGPRWTEKEIEEERRKREEDLNWFREPE